MDKNFTKEFDQCPVCGSKERFANELAKEVKDASWMRPFLDFFITIINGIVRDEKMEPNIPMGTKLPTYAVFLDVCMDCGTVYAGRLIRGEVEKKPNIVLPGRGQPPGLGSSSPRSN